MTSHTKRKFIEDNKNKNKLNLYKAIYDNNLAKISIKLLKALFIGIDIKYNLWNENSYNYRYI